MNNFAVFCNARTGSQFFETLISSHPNIYCYSEVFELSQHRPWQFGGFYEKRAKSFPAGDKENIQSYAGFFLDYIFNFLPDVKGSWEAERGEVFVENIRNCVPAETAVGFDMKVYQMNYIPGIRSLLLDREVRIIHLRRRNRLRHYISCKVNEQRKKFGIKAHGTLHVAHPKILFEYDDFLKTSSYHEKNDNFISETFSREDFEVLEIFYEDMLANPSLGVSSINREVLNKVYNLIDVKKVYNLTSPLKKTNPGRLEDLIENYDEMCKYLKNTEYEIFLN
jgi:hypothetical protein